MSTITFDPLDPQLLTAPQIVYERLRNEAPLLSTVVGGQTVHLVSRYADVARIISDPSARMNPPGSDAPAVYGDGPAAELWRSAISMMDPPQHTRARRVIARPFSLRRVEQMRSMVADIVNEIFSELPSNQLEVVNDLALRVPMQVICKLLGIPAEDWPSLQAWTTDFLHIFLPNVGGAEEIARVQKASQNFINYFGGMIDARRAQPRDDITSDFAALVDKENGISRIGLIGALRGLLTAGFETTAATISAAFLGFAKQPEQLELLRQNPELIPGAVDELLRWETPVQVLVRYLGRDIEPNGGSLQAGAACWLLLGSANHDPRHYPHPDKLDVSRAATDHHAFGGGRHFCVGAYLARLELQLVLQQMSQRYRRIELQCESAARKKNFQFPSIERLPVALVS